ncbi:MAG: glycosyltransferase family 2 protein [Ignavibacteriales bacterium]|nr:glycosyltransferase family 2 protein [Ignavibacteriales bacterium]
MYRKKCIAVVVPAYNEEKLIGRVVETMPRFVDHVVVVNDCSTDQTRGVLEKLRKSHPKLVLIDHQQNRGVGGAIATGYKWARDNRVDVAAVMGGDAQMDPSELAKLVDPVVRGWTDYAKGNRLFSGDAWKIIPRTRYIGNSILSFLTKIASGYWHVADSQSGYTAISKKALQMIDWDEMYPRYGQPNDLLVRLNVFNFRVVDVPVTPVYNIGEKSGIKLERIVFTLSVLLLRRFIWRMKQKYIIRDFHPLVLFYGLGFLLLFVAFLLGVRLLFFFFAQNSTPSMNAMAFLFTATTGFQSLFFAMWFDMFSNRDLKGKTSDE